MGARLIPRLSNLFNGTRLVAAWCKHNNLILVFFVFFLFLFLDLWLQWISDELPLCSIPEAALEMRELFEVAVKDYLCKYAHLNY